MWNGATKEYFLTIYSSTSLRDQIAAKFIFSAYEMEKMCLRMRTHKPEMKLKNILTAVTYVNKTHVGGYLVLISIAIILQWKDYQCIYLMKTISSTT